MIEIIPATDIIDGQCVRLTQGDYASRKTYYRDPLEAALRFEEAGIRRLVGHGGIARRPDGLGLGQPLHRFQAERLRRLVQPRQPHGILHPAGADQRRRFRTPG